VLLNSQIAYCPLRVSAVQRFNWNGHGLTVAGRPVTVYLASLVWVTDIARIPRTRHTSYRGDLMFSPTTVNNYCVMNVLGTM
jgi:hypothetical protein